MQRLPYTSVFHSLIQVCSWHPALHDPKQFPDEASQALRNSYHTYCCSLHLRNLSYKLYYNTKADIRIHNPLSATHVLDQNCFPEQFPQPLVKWTLYEPILGISSPYGKQYLALFRTLLLQGDMFITSSFHIFFHTSNNELLDTHTSTSHSF